jgi:MFS transporter, NNP family, nitrate/nitrite transporter
VTTTAAVRPKADGQQARRPYVMLGIATLGFALNFWAWALIAPLGAHFKLVLHLTSFQQAMVVAVPVIVGSLGRIPVGALTDRFGGRLMFPVVSFATIIPVLFLGLAGYRSLAALLIGGFFLGVAGTTFAVGVPFVSACPQVRIVCTCAAAASSTASSQLARTKPPRELPPRSAILSRASATQLMPGWRFLAAPARPRRRRPAGSRPPPGRRARGRSR